MGDAEKLFASDVALDDSDLATATYTASDSNSLSSSSLSIDSSDVDSATPSTSSKHPIAVFFHLFFKASAMFVYLFNALFIDDFILAFVICVLLISFDFWTVKNITGRLLVGLRWWNEVKPDGTNEWIYESKPNNKHVNVNDAFLFWTALYINPCIWILLGLYAIFSSWQSLLIVAVAVTLGVTNVIGYWRCQSDAQAKLETASRLGQLISAARLF